MATFDIVSKIDIQKLDNAINTVVREISTRYDLRDSKTTVEFDKKELSIHIVTNNDMSMKAVEGIIISRTIKQGLDSRCFDFGKEHYAAGDMVKKDVKINNGIEKETAKKIVKMVKETGIKVQASIMDDQIRVTGKKIDDLQSVIAQMKKSKVEIPLQYENFRN
jgi:cyclic-di-GMP-binding protein